MTRTVERDPLCYLLDHGPGPCDLCRTLTQARLQGPVRTDRHAPFCWCALCLAASDAIHGTKDGVA